ncbi:DUF7116 family protein [Halorarius halobius]|uniref:DUF7116 family protein n=1 Tax=Halorarius halobius TaxID=2962671 RepID=UPI0020CEA0DC|nr:hypothetical protein [Halorarius halobius]
MGAVSTPLIDRAGDIFRDLGYEVEPDGDELRATRKWRVVQVTTAEPDDAREDGRLRCFVARSDRAKRLQEELRSATPPYDWAVVSVGDEGYEVLHPDADVLPAP